MKPPRYRIRRIDRSPVFACCPRKLKAWWEALRKAHTGAIEPQDPSEPSLEALSAPVSGRSTVHWASGIITIAAIGDTAIGIAVTETG